MDICHFRMILWSLICDFSLFSLYFEALIFHSFHFSFFHNREQNDFSSFFANIIYKNGINYLNDKNSTFLNRRTTILNPFFSTVPNFDEKLFLAESLRSPLANYRPTSTKSLRPYSQYRVICLGFSEHVIG